MVAPVTPRRVLAVRPQNQYADLPRGQWTSRLAAGGLGPVGSDESAVPGEHRGRLPDQEHLPETVTIGHLGSAAEYSAPTGRVLDGRGGTLVRVRQPDGMGGRYWRGWASVGRRWFRLVLGCLSWPTGAVGGRFPGWQGAVLSVRAGQRAANVSNLDAAALHRCRPLHTLRGAATSTWCSTGAWGIQLTASRAMAASTSVGLVQRVRRLALRLPPGPSACRGRVSPLAPPCTRARSSRWPCGR